MRIEDTHVEDELAAFKEETLHGPDHEHQQIQQIDDSKSDNNSDFSTGSDSSKGLSDPGTNLIDRSDVSKFGLHLSLLLQKTSLMFLRNIRGLLIVLLCPILWCLVICFFNSQQEVLKDMEIKTGTISQLEPLEHCWGENCVTIGYSIIGDSNPEAQQQYEWIDDVMKSVSAANNLVF